MLTAQRWVGDTLGDRRLGLPELSHCQRMCKPGAAGLGSVLLACLPACLDR